MHLNPAEAVSLFIYFFPTITLSQIAIKVTLKEVETVDGKDSCSN